MKLTFRAMIIAGSLALLAPLAVAAQQIQVKDLESGDIIETVGPGETITLYPGDEVRLIMSVHYNGRTYYPQTEYWEGVPSGGAVRITRASVENANATIKAGAAGHWEKIGYRILEDVGGRTEGSVTIEVVEDDEE